MSYKPDLNPSRNYILEPKAEFGAGKFTGYADAAASRPVDGTGGVAAGISLIRSTSSPLAGLASFLLSKDAVNRQGEGFSYDFVIDSCDQSKVLNISFDYAVSSGTFVAGSDSADSDIIVYMYDTGNAQLIEPTPFRLFSNSSLSSRFSASFQTNSNSTTYRLILHIASTSASAYALKLDNFSISRNQLINASIASDWTSYTPTGSWSTNTTYTGKYRRVGDTLETDVNISLAGAPTSTTLTVNLPSGLSIDTSKLAASTDANNGFSSSVQILDSGTGNYTGRVLYSSTTAVLIQFLDDTSPAVSGTSVTETAPFTFGNTDELYIKFSVPISGWASQTQASDQSQNRRIELQTGVQTATGTVSTGYSAMKFTTPLKDTAGGYNTTTGGYTVPESGMYHIEIVTDLSASAVLTTQLSFIGLGVDSTSSSSYQFPFYPSSVSNTENSWGASIDFPLVAGQIIYPLVRSNWTTPAYGAGTSGCWFSVYKIQGPVTTLPIEEVNCRYINTAGTSIDNTFDTIPFATKVYDSHSAFNGATGVFTAPVSGKYRVSSKMTLASTSVSTTQDVLLDLYDNAGSFYSRLGGVRGNGTTTAWSVNGSDCISLTAGQSCTVRGFSDVTTTLNTTSGLNYIAIEKVG